ncbi:MAG TPA: uracil-DNA glycosylase family protein [Stellaceae bacterium]
MSTTRLDALYTAIRACTVCADLPLGPRPVLRGKRSARLMIVSQAPGTKVHETGLSFNDRSGDRLRDWLAIDRETFYDERRVAILPMGLCYPGRHERGGDLPPRPECAPLWHDSVLGLLPNIELTLLVGSYAIDHYLAERAKPRMVDTVASWREYLPRYFPLPHPSWRTVLFERKYPWFEADLLPALRKRVRQLI